MEFIRDLFSAIYRRHINDPICNDGDRAHLVGAHLKFSSLELENEAHEKSRCHLMASQPTSPDIPPSELKVQ